jgi:integrase
MIEFGLKTGNDVSTLTIELGLKRNAPADVFVQYIQSKKVSDERIEKLKRYSGILKVLLPKDFSKINMRILDEVRHKLIGLPKMNIQKYRIMPIPELLKIEIPEKERQTAETVNGYLKMLNALIKFAYEREMVKKPYAVSLLPKQKVQRDERQALTIDEIHRLLYSNDKLVSVYKILFYSGMRLSELYKCEISIIEGIKCFDLRSKQHILKSKSSYRIIPVHSFIAEDIELMLTEVQSIKSGYATRKTSEFFGIRGKTLHSIRHSFATLLIANDAESTIVSELLGHTQSGMTIGRYVKGYPMQILQHIINKLPCLNKVIN